MCAIALSACTSATRPAAPQSVTSRTSTTIHTGAPSTRPVQSGPTVAAVAARCPYVGTSFVRDTIGMRLGRVTVLRSGGRTVGCRFYALQGSPLHASERLPGPHQPAVEISTQRYPSAAAAHNGFVRIAEAGSNPQQVALVGGVVGVCFQTDFDPADHRADWACAANRGSIAVVVRTVVTSPALDARLVTARVLNAI